MLKTKKISNHKSSKKNYDKKIAVYNLFFGLIFVALFLFLVSHFVLNSVVLNIKESKNILIVSDNLDNNSRNISLAHISKKPEENLLIILDGNEVIKINENYGEYSLGSIYQLLKIDKKNDHEIKSVFSNILNLPIDQLVVLNGVGGDTDNKQLKKDIFENFRGKLINPSSLADAIRLYSLADHIDISKLDSVSEMKEKYSKLSVIDDQISETCSVAVVNTTPTSSLAKKVSEIIENMGLQVVQVESTSFEFENSTIYYPDDSQDCKKVVENISNIFPLVPKVEPSSNMPENLQFRAKITVMIGKDF
ncbi:LytR C-terminal domain-containing protein [Candidatus Woesebacteria bacterium]|nr:LytR C-terminal domain-containing protein [Candidatus Woesebacteria bacterium]